jgi:hypothetical protein
MSKYAPDNLFLYRYSTGRQRQPDKGSKDLLPTGKINLYNKKSVPLHTNLQKEEKKRKKEKRE